MAAAEDEEHDLRFLRLLRRPDYNCLEEPIYKVTKKKKDQELLKLNKNIQEHVKQEELLCLFFFLL